MFDHGGRTLEIHPLDTFQRYRCINILITYIAVAVDSSTVFNSPAFFKCGAVGWSVAQKGTASLQPPAVLLLRRQQRSCRTRTHASSSWREAKGRLDSIQEETLLSLLLIPRPAIL
jgi:hypothetical protein